MTVRHDKFQPGDEVIWTAHLYGLGLELSGGAEGPFRILTVRDVPLEPSTAEDGRAASNWRSMGHTQMVTVDGQPDEWSGAYFAKIEADDEQLRYETETGINDLCDDREALVSAGIEEGE